MSLFERAIRFFLFVLGLVGGLIVAAALFFVRYMVQPPRQPIGATPADAGLPFEAVTFPARDGLRLAGWFIPAGASEASEASSTPQPTIILVHGWPWTRLGEGGDNVMAGLMGAAPVDLLRLTHSLYGAGYSVLMFDLRNHGESAPGGPVTFGLRESNDLLGALEYVSGRDDVDSGRIGTVGFSMGGNTVLYTLPQTQQIKAAVAVQPTSVPVFAGRLAKDIMGPIGAPVLAITGWLYQQASGLRMSALEPVFAASGAGDVPVMYVQGDGDAWGSVENVSDMASVTPNPAGIHIVPTNHRFGGYRHVISHPELVTDFFAEHL